MLRLLAAASALVAAATAAPQAATNLRADQSNVHPASSTATTHFAINSKSELTLTWAAHHTTRGARQAAYQISVTDGKEEVFNSGKVASEAPLAVVPAAGLSTGRTFNWAVTVFDEHGAPSPTSEPAAFHIGPVDLDWTGVP